jgi:GTP pyrophosphokinase
MRSELQTLLQPLRSSLSKEQRQKISLADQWHEKHYQAPPRILGAKWEDPSWGLLRLVVKMKLDGPSILATLLLPLLRQQSVTQDEIRKQFGKEVCFLCETWMRLAGFSFEVVPPQDPRRRKQMQSEQAENFRKMLIAMARDLRVVLLRLCEVLFKIRNPEQLSVHEQWNVANECRSVYAPLANRLGVSWMKNELEDLSLRYLHPRDYYRLAKQVEGTQNSRSSYIAYVKKTLTELLASHGIECEVMGRSKHLNSIYIKLQKKKLTFDELYDITAFRAICESKVDCYRILGIIHDEWKPIQGRFKDYIALPKANMYQSLHTTVLGPQNRRMEVQIRTQKMHRLAEDGIAAHWVYKEGGKDQKTMEQFQWLRSLLKLSDDSRDDQEFLASVQDHIEEGEVFVFTPRGEVKELRRGATPVDFAYAIHTRVGESCVGARVNGKIVTLKYELQNGDFVEVMTSPTGTPSKDWLQFVKTGRAKTKIRSFFNAEFRAVAVDKGREALEKEMPSNRSLSKLIKNGALEEPVQDLGFLNLDDLLFALGNNKADPKDVVELLFPPEDKPSDEQPISLPDLNAVSSPIPVKRSKEGVLVAGMSDILVNFAKCCNPIPGDPIVGFISRGRGVIIHTEFCTKAAKMDQNRRVDVSWNTGIHRKHNVTLRVLSENRPGLLNQISRIFMDLKINISGANCRTYKDEAVNLFQCQVSDLDQLSLLTRQIEDVKGVMRVERMRQ